MEDSPESAPWEEHLHEMIAVDRVDTFSVVGWHQTRSWNESMSKNIVVNVECFFTCKSNWDGHKCNVYLWVPGNETVMDACQINLRIFM